MDSGLKLVNMNFLGCGYRTEGGSNEKWRNKDIGEMTKIILNQMNRK